MNKQKKKKKKRTNYGKLFEKNLENSLRDTTFYYRLRDNAAVFSKSKKTRFTTSNYCDYIIFYNFNLFMTECKSTKNKSLSFSNITKAQFEGFTKLEKFKNSGVIGIFAVEFRSLKQTYLINSLDILEYMKNPYAKNKKSFPVRFFEKKGLLLEIQEKKRKKLKVEEALNEFIVEQLITAA